MYFVSTALVMMLELRYLIPSVPSYAKTLLLIIGPLFSSIFSEKSLELVDFCRPCTIMSGLVTFRTASRGCSLAGESMATSRVFV